MGGRPGEGLVLRDNRPPSPFDSIFKNEINRKEGEQSFPTVLPFLITFSRVLVGEREEARDNLDGISLHYLKLPIYRLFRSGTSVHLYISFHYSYPLPSSSPSPSRVLLHVPIFSR